MRAILQVKILIFALIVSALLVISGCVSNGGGNVISYDFRSGTEGLITSFLKDAPPSEVYEETRFTIGLEISNEGAYDIEDGILLLSYEDAYVGIESWESSITTTFGYDNSKASFNLEGRNEYSPVGGKDFISVLARTKGLESQTETLTSQIRLTSCYDYETEFSGQVCIDTDPHNLGQKEKVCQMADESFSSQGGPVAVRKVESQMIPGEDGDIYPEFKIYIENLGRGQVYVSGKMDEACSALGLDYQDINKVEIKAELPDMKLDCYPKEFKLKDADTYVRCRTTRGISTERSAYDSPLIINLKYGYTQTISQEIEIKDRIT